MICFYLLYDLTGFVIEANKGHVDNCVDGWYRFERISGIGCARTGWAQVTDDFIRASFSLVAVITNICRGANRLHGVWYGAWPWPWPWRGAWAWGVTCATALCRRAIRHRRVAVRIAPAVWDDCRLQRLASERGIHQNADGCQEEERAY